MAKLPELCEIQYGYAFDSACFTEDNTHLPLVRIRDVKRGYSETFYSGNYPSDYVIDSGSLLVGMDGEFNIARWKGGHALLNQRVCKITAKENVNEEYIRFALSKALEEIENRTAFVTVKHLSAKELNQLEIDIPNYTTQTDVAKVLTQIESIISARQQQLQKLDEFVKARFVEMFGDSKFNTMQWPTKKLSELCDVSSSKRIYQNEQSTEGVPFLRISDLNERIDNVKNASKLFIPINKYNELKENGLVPTEGDILVTSRGTLGRCYIVRPEDEFYFQDGMISWLSDLSHQITSLYLSQLFGMSGIQKQIASLQAGSTVSYLSISMLKRLDIMLPPLNLQNQFAVFFEQTDKSKVAVQKALDEAQLLFDSLMQKYFQ